MNYFELKKSKNGGMLYVSEWKIEITFKNGSPNCFLVRDNHVVVVFVPTCHWFFVYLNFSKSFSHPSLKIWPPI
jgi:hypothetical protein